MYNPPAPREYSVVLIDTPAEGVRRITMNRPEKRNALNHTLRGDVLAALYEGDADPDVVMVVDFVTGDPDDYTNPTPQAWGPRAIWGGWRGCATGPTREQAIKAAYDAIAQAKAEAEGIA